MDNLEANGSITSIPFFGKNVRILLENFHSEKFLLWRDCQFALFFKISGTYYSVIVICLNITYFQMFLLKSTNGLSPVPPIFRRYDRAVVLSVKMAFFTVRSFRIFTCNFWSSTDYLPQSPCPCNWLPNLPVTHLSVLLSEAWPELDVFHWNILDFLSTTAVLQVPDLLE